MLVREDLALGANTEALSVDNARLVAKLTQMKTEVVDKVARPKAEVASSQKA